MGNEDKSGKLESDTNFNSHSPAPRSPTSNRENETSGGSVRTASSLALSPICGKGPKTVIAMRHGERMDDLFPNWIRHCEAKGGYNAFDSNMPLTLKPLSRRLADYDNDTPLTVMGNVMAQMVGRGLLINNLYPDVIYSSPALRCVQTAAVVAGVSRAATSGSGGPLIRVEPGLFENNDLYPSGAPSWLEVNELCRAGFNVDHNYKPFFSRDDVWFHSENATSYNRRINATFDEILRQQAKENMNGCVLISGHASTVDLAVGYFAVPRRFIAESDLAGIGDRIPYCATAVFRRQSQTDDTPYNIWRYYGEAALPPITYHQFTSRIDHQFLLRRSAVQRGVHGQE